MTLLHRGFFSCVFFLCAFLSGVARAELQTLSDDVLADAQAQDGIALRLDLRLNADVNGNQLASCTAVLCRFAIQSNNRGGEWLVLKSIYGRWLIPKLNLDAGFSVGSRDAATGNPTSTNVPSLLMTLPQAIQLYNITIGAMAMEYDSGTLDAGMKANAKPSFGGLRIHDSQQAYGSLTVSGSATIYGF